VLLLVVLTNIGEQPVSGLRVKLGTGGASTQMLWVSELAPQDTPASMVMLYVPGTVKDTTRFAEPDNQALGAHVPGKSSRPNPFPREPLVTDQPVAGVICQRIAGVGSQTPLTISSPTVVLAKVTGVVVHTVSAGLIVKPATGVVFT
jgi:hypothetical protein